MFKIVDVNNNELTFDFQESGLFPIAGLGIPPIQYAETRGFLSDTVIVDSFVSNPRDILLRLVVSLDKQATRMDYWTKRNELLALFSPFSSPLKLVHTLPDGTQKELTELYPTSGINFTNVEQNISNYVIDEIVSLTAKNPLWFGVSQTTSVLVPSTITDLVFPITFPILFGTSGSISTTAITYNGTWKSYPTITIQGAYTTCTITYKDAVILLNTNISSTSQRIITLDRDNLSIVDGNGNNKFSELGQTSDLSNFYFSPNDTNETFQVSIIGKSDTTQVTLSYSDVFVGI